LKHMQMSKPEQPAQPVTINFTRSGKNLPWDTAYDSLLDFAEAHDIAVDSACRSGSCGSCQTEIHSGDIAYHQQPDAEVTQGHCLLCIATPKNDLILNA
jgi:uncharacterized protein